MQKLLLHGSFLSHIAHVSTMISLHTKSQNLKDKFKRLKHFSCEEYIDDHLPGERYTPTHDVELQAAIKVRLWKILQKLRSHGAVATTRKWDWMSSHIERSLNGRLMIGYDDTLTGDVGPFCHENLSENFQDGKYEVTFENIADGCDTCDDYGPTMPIKYEERPSGTSIEDLFDSKSSSACNSFPDELLDFDDQMYSAGTDHLLFDDMSLGEDRQSIDLEAEQDPHEELLLDH